MILRDYQCTNPECGEIEEVFERPNSPFDRNCSKCKSPMKRMVAATNFALKGAGWYKGGFHAKK